MYSDTGGQDGLTEDQVAKRLVKHTANDHGVYWVPKNPNDNMAAKAGSIWGNPKPKQYANVNQMPTSDMGFQFTDTNKDQPGMPHRYALYTADNGMEYKVDLYTGNVIWSRWST